MDEYLIHRAAEIGDVEKVKHLIQNGVSIDSVDNKKHTPLHWAAKNGQLKVTELLIDQKCNLDLKANNGGTAVLLAAEGGHEKIVELLLHSGADANCCSEIGKWTILHHASRGGWTDTVKVLVENKSAELNAKTTLGATSLLLAASEGYADVVELLIEAGADVNCCDADSWTVLHYAVKRSWLYIVKKIVGKKEGKFDARNYRGINPLLLAAYEGHMDVVETLIDVGSFVNWPDVYQNNILHYASNRGWLHIVKKILKMTKFTLNKLNSQGNTPLHLACGMHNTEIVNELLLAGADVSIANNKGEYALV